MNLILLTLAALLAAQPSPGAEGPGRRWSKERAERWYNSQPWPVGCNYIPSTAINQI